MNARNVTVTVTQPGVFMMKRLMSGTSLWISTVTTKVAESVRNARIILRETTVKDANRDFSDLMKLRKPIPANVRAIIIRIKFVRQFLFYDIPLLQNLRENFLPLRFRKAGKVWCGGARETHYDTCHNRVTPSKTKKLLKTPCFFRS